MDHEDLRAQINASELRRNLKNHADFLRMDERQQNLLKPVIERHREAILDWLRDLKARNGQGILSLQDITLLEKAVTAKNAGHIDNALENISFGYHRQAHDFVHRQRRQRRQAHR